MGPVWFLKCKMLTPAQCVGSEQVSGHLSLTVSVTKELRSPVEQKAKSINLRGTPAPPPPLPQTHGVLLPCVLHHAKYLNSISIQSVWNNKMGQELSG